MLTVRYGRIQVRVVTGSTKVMVPSLFPQVRVSSLGGSALVSAQFWILGLSSARTPPVHKHEKVDCSEESAVSIFLEEGPSKRRPIVVVRSSAQRSEFVSQI